MNRLPDNTMLISDHAANGIDINCRVALARLAIDAVDRVNSTLAARAALKNAVSKCKNGRAAGLGVLGYKTLGLLDDTFPILELEIAHFYVIYQELAFNKSPALLPKYTYLELVADPNLVSQLTASEYVKRANL
jgi:hypothetical protein